MPLRSRRRVTPDAHGAGFVASRYRGELCPCVEEIEHGAARAAERGAPPYVRPRNSAASPELSPRDQRVLRRSLGSGSVSDYALAHSYAM